MNVTEIKEIIDLFESKTKEDAEKSLIKRFPNEKVVVEFDADNNARIYIGDESFVIASKKCSIS